MTIHRSFAGSGGLTKHRNVLTRQERLDQLKATKRWDKDQGIFGLPKVRSIKVK